MQSEVWNPCKGERGQEPQTHESQAIGFTIYMQICIKMGVVTCVATRVDLQVCYK